MREKGKERLWEMKGKEGYEKERNRMFCEEIEKYVKGKKNEGYEEGRKLCGEEKGRYEK